MERVPAQTSKQAKAAYKARNTATLNEAARRRIERDSLLHRRAWAVKEREKSRLVAAQKKAEREQRERAELANAAHLATQRRRDKFGYKSSQYHLGAFFTKASSLTKDTSKEEREISAGECTADLFDDDFDADAMLSAVRTPVEKAGCINEGRQSLERAIGNNFTSSEDTRLIEYHGEQLDWLAFDSSTQIARELDNSDHNLLCTEDSLSPSQQPSVEPTEYSLGLASQDLEKLDFIIADSLSSKEMQDQEAMPAPVSVLLNPQVPQETITHQPPRQSSSQAGTLKYPAEDFSSTQLEDYLDDDLVLTQA